ncbi:nucleoside triphosphate pyrophosphohydrolase [Clostridium peptidivorans]|uniref:nucleoside triphosphate pyrophosphohydrolase n=1 Tax=Clostridium peptidivorans TaxID=100174 RepID=UPI000BE464BB|nr:nucleoside triphosphate pyrophosphohydrolase [Clostridium peptidivorans]
MSLYNKLVRDKVPEVLEQEGKKYVIQYAEKEKMLDLLKDKLKEEAREFFQDDSLEGLADIVEVVFSLANELGYSEEEVLVKRTEKREEKGGFEERIVLERVCE